VTAACFDGLDGEPVADEAFEVFIEEEIVRDFFGVRLAHYVRKQRGFIIRLGERAEIKFYIEIRLISLDKGVLVIE